ncbi:MAG: hypothetical protein PHN92_14250 [Geobacter sp.]|nr:hypothetical protein [Geobacter sp.]
MTTFIPANSLKQQYNVFGHFYSLNSPSADPLKCRSVLEITIKNAPASPIADAIFVMMNPGSSRPLVETTHMVDSDNISDMEVQLVPTVPDTTQYQIMRVMHFLSWQHIRVLNLSDLRDSQSSSFADRYMHFETTTNCKTHSIFASERSAELKRNLFRKNKAPIVCAWGVSDDLNPLIERAMGALASELFVTGLAKTGKQGKYFHPLPSLQKQKEEWVFNMLKQLNS